MSVNWLLMSGFFPRKVCLWAVTCHNKEVHIELIRIGRLRIILRIFLNFLRNCRTLFTTKRRPQMKNRKSLQFLNAKCPGTRVENSSQSSGEQAKDAFHAPPVLGACCRFWQFSASMLQNLGSLVCMQCWRCQELQHLPALQVYKHQSPRICDILEEFQRLVFVMLLQKLWLYSCDFYLTLLQKYARQSLAFLGKFGNTYRARLVRYPLKQALKSFVIASPEALHDMISIAAGPLR